MWSPTHVQVTVCRAKGLLTKGKHGTNDAFVTIALGKEKYQTSVKQKAVQDVDWQEECELSIPTQGNTAEIALTVLHQNFLGVDEFLGMVTLPLASFDVYERPRARWYQLKSKPGHESKSKQRGELEVRVAFTVKSGSMLDLSSKKDKHRGSFSQISQAASSLGGSLMSLGSKEKKGIKKLASSVGNKLRIPGRGEKGELGKFSRHSSGRRSDKYSSGEPDPGVISEDEDEFRFDELSHKSSGSSLNISNSRNASVNNSLENLGGGEFLRRNSMPRGHLPPSGLTMNNSRSNLSQASSTSPENPPKPPRSNGPEAVAALKSGKLGKGGLKDTLTSLTKMTLDGEEEEEDSPAGIPSIVVQDKLEEDQDDLSHWSRSTSSKRSSRSRRSDDIDHDHFDIVPDLTPIIDERMEQMNAKTNQSSPKPVPLPRSHIETSMSKIADPEVPKEDPKPIKISLPPLDPDSSDDVFPQKEDVSVKQNVPVVVQEEAPVRGNAGVTKVSLSPLNSDSKDQVRPEDDEIPAEESVPGILQESLGSPKSISVGLPPLSSDSDDEVPPKQDEIPVRETVPVLVQEEELLQGKSGSLIIPIGNVIDSTETKETSFSVDLVAEEAAACEYLERVIEESESQDSPPHFVQLVTSELRTPDWELKERTVHFTPAVNTSSTVEVVVPSPVDSEEPEQVEVVELDWLEPEPRKEDSVESQGLVDSQRSLSPARQSPGPPSSPDSAVSEGVSEPAEVAVIVSETLNQSAVSKKSLEWDMSDVRMIESPPVENINFATSTPMVAGVVPVMLATEERQRNLAASLQQRVVVGEDASSTHLSSPNLAQSEPANYHVKSREELLTVLQERDQQITDLKEYIGKLLVRVMDECPALLQTPFEKSGGKF